VGVQPERITLHKPCVSVASGLVAGRSERTPVRIAFVGNDFERKGGPRLLGWHQARWASRAELHICSSKARPDHSLKGVVWHGKIPHARLMNEILPSCDMMVVPTWEDTFLVAAQEAQAIGLPVVTSRLAGLPEVVRHGRTGFVYLRDDEVSFVSAVERLIEDPALRRSMSRAAREHAAANLNGGIWYNHLLDQLVAVAHGRVPAFAPAGVDIRMSDDESGNPETAAESAAKPACRI
jgi:glycosyltransferase involved in cell wall biosynthesis